jgi:hypothetical protein
VNTVLPYKFSVLETLKHFEIEINFTQNKKWTIPLQEQVNWVNLRETARDFYYFFNSGFTRSTCIVMHLLLSTYILPLVLFCRKQLHVAEPFLRSRQSLNYSRNSQHFMEPEASLPCSQEPATGPCREPDESSSHSSYFFKINFNIIL